MLAGAVAQASNSLAASHERNSTLSFSLLRGAPADASLEDICCGRWKDGFVENGSNRFSTEFGESIFWLRLNSLAQPGILDFGPMLDDVTLFRRDPLTGAFTSSRAGDILPPQSREMLAPNIVFAISENDINKQLYVRFSQPKYTSVVVRYFDVAEYSEALNTAKFNHSVLISAIAMMMIFNLLLGFLVRQLIFVLNAGFVFCISIVNLYFTGVGAAYIWGPWAWASNYLFELSAISGSAIGLLFVYYFLRDSTQPSSLVRALWIFPVLALIVLAGWMVLPPWMSQITQIILAISSLLYAALVVLVLSIHRQWRALWMLPGIIFAVGPGIGMVLAFKYFSIEPILPAEHVFEITMVIEALFFSLILAFRMRLAEREAMTAYSDLDHVQKNLNKNMLRAIDNERRRIAADLHDTAGQGLMAIANRLGRILAKEKAPIEQREEMIKVADYSRGVVGDIRRISHELHPAIIDHLGWREAIEELFTTLSQVNDVEVDLKIDIPEKILDVTQKLHLYRIVQEAVSNIAKHAHADKCYARFELKNGFAQVEIRDNGRSKINSKNEETSLSLGQLIIDQRIAVLNGEWKTKRKNEQTVLQFNFPLASAALAKGAAT